MKGRLYPNRKGRYLHSAGYVLVWMPEHPRAASRGYVMEHIVIAEKVIGRPLSTDDHVHHLDGNKTNNDPSNLIVLSNAEHQKYHVARLIEARRRKVAQRKTTR